MYDSIDIIGGGIIGTTLATELLCEIRRRGFKTEVHLFEKRGQLGIENTEKSFEGVRTYWFTPEEIRFYLASIRAFCDLAAHFGHDARFDDSDLEKGRITAHYRPVGYHYFLSEKEFNGAKQLKELFDEERVPIEFYSKEEAKKIGWIGNNFDLEALVLDEDEWVYRDFDLDAWMEKEFDFGILIPKDKRNNYDIAGYVHVPVAGFVSASDIVSSYRALFEKLGGKLHLCTEVVGLVIKSSTVEAVEYRFRPESGTDGGVANNPIETKPTNYVVNATGVWADDLNQNVIGERLGIIPHRRLAHIVKPPEGYKTDHGMVMLNQRVIRPDQDKIWLYFTPEEEKVGIEEQSPDNTLYDEYFYKYIYPVFCDRERPFIRNAGAIGMYSGVDARGWMGHYADTPDEKPLIGVPRPNTLENYAVSTGYSGHGVQASVAAALGLTHKILQLKGRPDVEIPEIYDASRDLTQSKPDHSRL